MISIFLYRLNPLIILLITRLIIPCPNTTNLTLSLGVNNIRFHCHFSHFLCIFRIYLSQTFIDRSLIFPTIFQKIISRRNSTGECSGLKPIIKCLSIFSMKLEIHQRCQGRSYRSLFFITHFEMCFSLFFFETGQHLVRVCIQRLLEVTTGHVKLSGS